MNEPVVAPAATVTLAGTVRPALLLDRATTAPPVGAAPLKVMVQALVPGPVRLDGEHVRLLTVTGAFKVMAEVELEPLAVAVTVAVESLAMVPAVAEKVPVAEPAATVIEAGVVRDALFEARFTGRPPVGAAALTVTVHVLAPPELSEAGMQARLVSVTGGTRLTDAVFEVLLYSAVTTTDCALETVAAVALNQTFVAN